MNLIALYHPTDTPAHLCPVLGDLAPGQVLLVAFLILLDFLFQLLEQITEHNPLRTTTIGQLLERSDFGYLFIMLLQYLFNIILNLLDLLFSLRLCLFLFALQGLLKIEHLPFHQRNKLIQYDLYTKKIAYILLRLQIDPGH